MRGILYTLSAVFILITACTSGKMTPTPPAEAMLPLPDFDLEGHRGARGLLPENTIPAMLKALELGVTTLEMDAHISQDGQVLLSHDPYFNREHELLPTGEEIPKVNAKKYLLYQMPYSQIRTFDVGSKYYSKFPQQQLMKAYKPLLSEVIDSAQAYIKENNLPQVFYNIETKSKPSGDGKYHPAPEDFMDRLVAVIDEKKIRPYVIIQSFDPRTLQVLHRKHPDIKTSLLVENLKGLEKNLEQLGFTPNIYSPYAKLVTPALVEATHRYGIKIIPWTVNSLEEMQRLKALGVDGLISDYPDLYKKL
ncbi:glycerophosphodiester phosphodiesterase family protein [Pontibacter anaerobius]|uniref:Glycerophosphodiester phosphodiesterase family protein n=1 Tax=Pontibacter anaerobius TaxID=2993940 RepID=A0ABT3RJV2_9BACT|nr:glycerophosphodiester phosphodiesterase family protein [Pontibacter anaerobius]MCX2741840.1 glycerophosphodiester phosphodiesterase family protein [Pontibacter anaerobius]